MFDHVFGWNLFACSLERRVPSKFDGDPKGIPWVSHGHPPISLTQEFEDCKWLDVGESYWEIETGMATDGHRLMDMMDTDTANGVQIFNPNVDIRWYK